MKRMLLVLAAAVAFAAPSAAQEIPEAIARLQADGAGSVQSAPDIVAISIGVSSRGETPTEALSANNAAMQAVIDAIVAAGVAEADIATSNFSINPVYAQQRPGEENLPPAIIAYEVSNQVDVRIRDMAASGTVLDQVVAAGANRINGIRFDIDEPAPLQDEATRLAIADAIRKGELMAEAAGVRLVRILSVSAFSNAQPMYDQAVSFRSAVPIMGGEQSISANATIVWEIAPQ